MRKEDKKYKHKMKKSEEHFKMDFQLFKPEKKKYTKAPLLTSSDAKVESDPYVLLQLFRTKS